MAALEFHTGKTSTISRENWGNARSLTSQAASFSGEGEMSGAKEREIVEENSHPKYKKEAAFSSIEASVTKNPETNIRVILLVKETSEPGMQWY